MVTWDTLTNITSTATSAIKTSGSDSYTDNVAMTVTLGTSGDIETSFTPSAVDSKNYIGGLNQGLPDGSGATDLADIAFCWNGAGATGKAYCLQKGSVAHTINSGLTTSSLLKVNYNIGTKLVSWYLDGSLVHSQTSTLDSFTSMNGVFGAKQSGVGVENIGSTTPPSPSGLTHLPPPPINLVRF